MLLSILLVILVVGCVMQFAFNINVLGMVKKGINKLANLVARMTDEQ